MSHVFKLQINVSREESQRLNFSGFRRKKKKKLAREGRGGGVTRLGEGPCAGAEKEGRKMLKKPQPGSRREARLGELMVITEFRKGYLVGADPPGGARGREEY